MKCTLCKHGQTQAGKVNVSLQRNDATVIIKSVPAEVCDNCGEYYLSEEMTELVLQKAEEAVRKGAEVEILRLVA